MPALRIFCYNCQSGNRHLVVLLRWIADDDLRGIAKYSIFLRGMQLLILLPTFVVLVQTYVNTKHLFDNTTTTNATTTTTIFPSAPCNIRKLSIIVWFFWSSSFFTVIF